MLYATLMRKIDIISLGAEKFKRVVDIKQATSWSNDRNFFKTSEVERKKSHKIGRRELKLCEEDTVHLKL